MMTVKEYASDVKRSVKEIIDVCLELGIKAYNANDELSEDDIIDLDNNLPTTIQGIDDEDILEEKASQIASSIKLDDTIKSQKLKKKSEQRTEDFVSKRKEMYKNKEKLISNTPQTLENTVIYKEGMTLSELGKEISVDPLELIKKFMSVGVMANMNSTISFDDAELVLVDYDKKLKKEETQDESNFEKLEITDDEKFLEERPPVVTIMGHVDHGKTTLLDTIRKSKVVSDEFGGITQHIGAYQIEYNKKKITFIDTPGHAAFTEMRARGASITDIVIIVVSADDGVMPQTKEAIDHAKAAKVPIIVAINKIDKPNANIERVMTEMAENGITPDVWGGDVVFAKISALTGEGIEGLLENILLIAEMSELHANPNRYALGTVIESRLDKNVGPVVTLLVQNGILRLGDPIVVGTTHGKVRTLKDDVGKELVEALPSTPVEITGVNETPSAGDRFMAFETEKQARTIGETRKLKAKLKCDIDVTCGTTIDDLFSKINCGVKEINIILKADAKGSEEAVKNVLQKIQVEDVKINIIRSGTGTITESDVVLANASSAIIIGFNVKPSSNTMEMAKAYCVDIRLHNIIYKIKEELELAMMGMLEPIYEEKILGNAIVRRLFKFSKVGTIAGSYVKEGTLKSNARARVIRGGNVIHDGSIQSLQREKESVKEVKLGIECGITLVDFDDIKEEDIIEAYEMVEVKRK